MTQPAICLIDGGSRALDQISAQLSACGFITWNLQTIGDFERRRDKPRTFCMIIDLPGAAGLELLEALRRRTVRVPALLIADSNQNPCLIEKCAALDILTRPVNLRQLFAWIECISIAQLSFDRPHAKNAAGQEEARVRPLARALAQILAPAQ